jgi:hypothetical protein
MELGEPVSPPSLGVSDQHSESTCPWHAKEESSAAEMDATDPDEDIEAMPDNNGGKLGRNLKGKGGTPPPDYGEVKIFYKPGTQVFYQEGVKQKKVQTYENSPIEVVYRLQYAPHHLIPGNESLKDSAIVKFLGADPVIKNFNETGIASRIKDNQSAGYDVNDHANGVWLPSPYALSMKNAWPGAGGVDVLKKRQGFDAQLIQTTEDFHQAYVAASITVTGAPRQFHMRHEDYSEKVQEILGAIATRMTAMASTECPIAKSNKTSDDKVDAPKGLRSRLNVLSANLKGFLCGPLWRAPLFTDKSNERYLEDLKKLQKLKVSKSKGDFSTIV